MAEDEIVIVGEIVAVIVVEIEEIGPGIADGEIEIFLEVGCFTELVSVPAPGLREEETDLDPGIEETGAGVTINGWIS